MTRGLYQGWVGWRNLGDEALFEACRRQLPRIEWTAAALDDAPGAAMPKHARGTSWLRRALGRPTHRVAMLGGGTVLNRTPAWLEQYRLLQHSVQPPVELFSPGVADPAFWQRVPGWRDTRADWRAELAGLAEIGVRGPISKRLLDEAGFRNVFVAGDPALSFRRAIAPAAPRRQVVGINAGRANGTMWGSEDEALARLADAARLVAAAGFEVRVFPVWDYDESACRELARRAELPADAIDPLLLDADAFLDYVGGFDVVVTIKLHAAVLAAAAGVPFVAVEYQPKVLDFTQSIGWDRYTFRSDAFEPADIVRAVRELDAELDTSRVRLGSAVAELAAMQAAYAARVEERLLC